MKHDHDRRAFDEAQPITADSFGEVIDLPRDHRERPDDADNSTDKASAAKKVRRPSKPGPTKRRADAPHRIPLNVGLQATDKMKLLRVIARDNRLTAAQVRAAVPLVDLVHSEKGHSFFSWDYLGNECGLGWQAAKRAAEKLQELGYVNIDHIEGDKVHTSLNLMMIDADVPKEKRAMSRDKAREMYGQTSPSERHDEPEDDESQRHVVPGGMYGGTSPEMYGGTSGEVYGGTSGGMYGQTSKSEIPLREAIQRLPLREEEHNVRPDAGAPEPTICALQDLEEEPVIGFVPEHPLSWKAVAKEGRCRNWVSPVELASAVERIEAAWPGNREPNKGYEDNSRLVARALMAGWTVDQIIDPMYLYDARMHELESFGMRLIRYFAEEFDLFGEQAKGERDAKRLLNSVDDDSDAWGF